MSEEQQVNHALAVTPAGMNAEVDCILAYLNLESSGELLPEPPLSIVDRAMRQKAKEIQRLTLDEAVRMIPGFGELMRRREVYCGALKIIEWYKRQLARRGLHI